MTSIKNNWRMKELSEICDIERGSSPRPIKYFVTNDTNGVNWIKIGDAGDCGKYLYATQQKITQDGAKKSKLVSEGDFIISNSMSYGRPYILKTSGCIHDGWFVLRLKKNLIDPNFLYYVLSSSFARDQYDHLSTGAIVKNIAGALIKHVKCPLPPLIEQKRIVALLDKVFDDISKAKKLLEQNIVNTKALFQSTLTQAFTKNTTHWERTILGDITTIVNGGTPDTKIKEFWGGDNCWLTPAEMSKRNSPYISDTSRKLTDAGLSSCSAKMLPVKSVILSSRAPIGYLLINEVSMATNQGCKGLIPNKKLFYKFLYYYLLFKYDYLQEIGSGTTFKEVSATTLKEVPFVYPPLAEQKKIVAHLDAVQTHTNKLLSLYQQKLSALDTLKQSILTQAFNGDL